MKIIISTLVFFIGFKLNGQNIAPVSIALPSKDNQFAISALTNYSDLYTGKVIPRISIYNLALKELNIPIEFLYTSTGGIKVQEVSSTIGLGWKLKASGSISRIVRGIPDENNNGYIGINHFGNTLNNAGTTGLTNDLLNKIGNNEFDGEPDIFNVTTPFFDFQFVFDENGNTVFPNQNGFKITHDLNNNPNYTSTSFVVTDLNGTKYYFGTDVNSREKLTVNSSFYTSNANNNYISTWYLDKIESFNKKDLILFNYETYTDYQINNYSVVRNQLSTTSQCSVDNNPIITNVTQTTIYNSPKYLSSIVSSIGLIEFKYLYDRRDIINGGRLFNIEVYSINPATLAKGDILKRVEFTHSYFGEPSNDNERLRLKLDKIETFGKLPQQVTLESQTQTFIYNNSQNLPKRNSEKFDSWGFYNNNLSGTALIPAADKNPDFSKTSANILTSIKSPTGYTENYEYELNNYKNQSGINVDVGGLRIKKITKTTSTGENLFTTYSYHDENGKSYGQISNNLYNNFQLYRNVFLYGGGNNFCLITALNTFSESIYNNYDLNGTFIGYSKVKSVDKNGGFEINTYTNFIDFPDSYNNTTPNNQIYGYSNSPQLSAASSFAYKRGLLLNNSIYNADGNIISQINNTYNSITINQDKCFSVKATPLTYILSGAISVWIYGHYYQKNEIYKLILSTKKEYGQLGQLGNYILNTNSYDYCLNNFQINSITTIDSKGNSIKKQFYHSDDLNIPMVNPSEQVAINDLILANNKSSIIHESVIKNNNFLQFQRHNTYTKNLFFYKTFLTESKLYNQNFVLKSDTYNYDYLSANLISTKSFPSGKIISYLYGYNYSYPVAYASNISNSEFFHTSFEDYNYNSSLNIIYANTAHTGKAYCDAITSSYTVPFIIPNSRRYIISWWAYLNNEWINNKQIYTNNINISGIIDDLSVFPDDGDLTTYTYMPLIGISSESNLNNKIRYYEYDNFNKLSLIRDERKNILKKICYNYLGQPMNCSGQIYYNTSLSVPFTRNDCGYGYIGTVVNYQVLGNAYSSYLSQLVADQLAMDDANTNGQNYANQFGNCEINTICDNVVCPTEGEKCVNGNCEIGVRVYTESRNEGGTWFCTYHYEFSDGSWSSDYYQTSGSSCI